MKISVHDQLTSANQAITLALADTTIQSKLGVFGFGLAQLQAGRALYLEAWHAHQEHERVHRAQLMATDAFHQAWRAAQVIHQVHLAAARRVLTHEREVQPILRSRGRSFTRWAAHAYDFYEAVQKHPSYGELLATVNVAQADLQKGEDLLAAANAAKAEQLESRAATRVALRQRNKQLRTLREWMIVFGHIARRVFAQEPEVLVKIGFTPTRSVHTSAETAEEPQTDIEPPVLTEASLYV